MEFLKEWTFCVCVSLVIAVILSLFAPQGRMKSFYKMLIALFVFVSFLYPFRHFRMPDFPSAEKISPSFSASEEGSSYELLINRQVTDVLTEKGIVGSSVSSSAHYDAQSGEITLHSVRVAVPDEYDTAEVQALLLEALGIHAEVIHIGD